MSNRKVSLGSAVVCTADKILGKKHAENIFGKGNAATVLQGVVLGQGAGCKWRVGWVLPDGAAVQSEHGARVLTPSNAATTATNHNSENLGEQNEEAEASSADESFGKRSDDSGSNMGVDSESQRPDASGVDLRVNELQWMQEPNGILDDWRAQAGYTSKERQWLVWRTLGMEVQALDERSRLHYFRLFMPDILDLVVTETDVELEIRKKSLQARGNF